MADTFVVVGQRPGIQAMGGTRTQDVVFVGIVTKPSGIYVEFPVLKTGYSSNVVRAAALGWANIAETLASEEWVAGVQWTEVVNAANQLVPSWVLTVVSSSGESADQLTIANAKLGPDLDKTAIVKLHDQLDATEAL